MAKHPPAIIGAGLAGLLAAHAFPTFVVHESSTGPRAEHRALLRFRGDSVARLTGIEFRKVRVRKGVWMDGEFCAPNIQLANLYALKCLDRLVGERSIWNIEAVDRFVAPETFYEQMLDACRGRILWGSPGAAQMLTDGDAPIISTAPLPETLRTMGIGHSLDFARAAIQVQRFRIPGADVFQTIYFPSHETPVYRASITGDLLIIESRTQDDITHHDLDMVHQAFGLDGDATTALDSTSQRFGKIAPVDDAKRKALVYALTQSFGIFSVGRFATWRNLLLDDVVDDLAVVKRLLRTASAYDRARAAA